MTLARTLIALFVTAVSLPTLAAETNPASIKSDKGAWPLYRQWTPAEVDRYAKWIEHVFEKKLNGTREQQLAKLERVLTDPDMNLLLDPSFVGEPSNPQIDAQTLRAGHTILDCGKLTVFFGAYYSYRRGLPWMATYVRACDGGDLRTCAYTTPGGDTSNLDYPTPYDFIKDAVQGFCTGNYRVEPDRPGAERSDTVPVAITPQTLKPGAMFYLDGHVLFVAQIDPYGEIRFLDATTSTTRDIYTHNRMNAVTGITPMQQGDQPYSGCFRGFRVTRWPIAETDSSGNVIRVRRRTDEEMKQFGYSTEQYAKLAELTRTGRIVEGNVAVDSIHDFIRLRMRSARNIDPMKLLDDYAMRLLQLAQEREKLVQAGWKSAQSEGPIPFPEGSRDANIYNANGRWGDLSTTALDTRIRGEYFAMISDLESAVNWYKFKPDFVKLPQQMKKGVWGQADLAMSLAMAKEKAFHARRFAYTNSQGKQIMLTLADLEQRIYDISFDPNHAPEFRWGAPAASGEAQTAILTATPLPNGKAVPVKEAYARQAFYRTMTYRDIEETHLETMVTSGFPILSKFNEHFATRWRPERVPPLVPHGWKNFWLGGRERLAQAR